MCIAGSTPAEMAWLANLFEVLGIPLAVAIVCGIALYRVTKYLLGRQEAITKEQNDRYDQIVTKHDSLEKEVRDMLVNQIAANNQHMNQQTQILERMDNHLQQHSVLLKDLVDKMG